MPAGIAHEDGQDNKMMQQVANDEAQCDSEESMENVGSLFHERQKQKKGPSPEHVMNLQQEWRVLIKVSRFDS